MPEKSFLTPKQQEQAKVLFCKDLSPEQADQFITVCERMELDPFTRQIYARAQNTKKKGPNGQDVWVKELVIITSIDGMRTVAERSGEYRGQTVPEFYYSNDEGKLGWYDVWIGKGNNGLSVPEAARVGIYRKDFPHPLVRVARYHSMVQMAGTGQEKSPTAFWRRMPDVMLLKCAEAAALRAAFPLYLGGTYIEEEIGNVHEEAPEDVPTTTVETPAAETAPATEPAKRTRKPKPETPPAETAPAKEEAKAPEAPADELPFGGPEEKVPEKEDGFDVVDDENAPEWKGHIIECVGHVDFKGKKLGDMDFVALERLRKGWAQNKEKEASIKASPKATHEANLIVQAWTAKKPA